MRASPRVTPPGFAQKTPNHPAFFAKLFFTKAYFGKAVKGT